MRLSLTCMCAAALLAAAPASAAWYKAASKHFVIYADENPKALRAFSEKLERFDQAARISMSMEDPQIGDGNRLTVFVVPSEKEVHAILGDKNAWQSGFYTGRVEGSLAYVPRHTEAMDDPDALFFHEYTHHLMMQELDRPYPEWYVEGFAEFLSTAKFDPDGSVWFGQPLQSRAYSLLNESPPTFEQLAAGLHGNMTDLQLDAFYGRSWLLTHYLLLEPRRAGQLARYINTLAKGEPPMQAAREVFGDPKQLDRELNTYVTQRLLAFKIGGQRISVGNIDVQPLSAGAAQVILARARIKYSGDDSGAETRAAQVRPIESRYPGDELVEATLAEAELDAGHADAAEAAAVRALAANPRDTEALVLKARALEAKAKSAEGETRTAMFDQARASFIAANKIDTEDPEPLYDYYWSYLLEGRRPTDNAIAALHYASDLAPQDIGVRMNSAIAYLEEGKLKEARSTLTVVAYQPHAGEAADLAKRMMSDIDSGDAKAALREMEAAPKKQSASN
ncbi:MAG: tetratricopeptide repeat protein [Bacillota bacterium]